MIIKELLFHLIPNRFKLPAFYFYTKFKGCLEPELLIIKKILNNCRTAVDVGANKGLYTYYLSTFAGQVVSFEPQPSCYAIINAYHKDNLLSYNVGLSNHADNINLFVPLDYSGKKLEGLASFRFVPNSEVINISVKTLDSYNLNDVDFIKIDVEGHELQVLMGADLTIKRNRPVLLVEIEQRHIDVPIDEVISYILNLGYKGYFLRKGELIEVVKFTFENDQKPFLANVFDQNYINNFFFFPN